MDYEPIKYRWRTPPEFLKLISNKLEQEIWFDACADRENRVAPYFLSREGNCLTQPWVWPGMQPGDLSWMNPPYGVKTKDFPGTGAFMVRARNQSKVQKIRVACLIEAATDTHWFCDAVQGARGVIFLEKRVSFLHPSGGKSESPKRGHALIIYDGTGDLAGLGGAFGGRFAAEGRSVHFWDWKEDL